MKRIRQLIVTYAEDLLIAVGLFFITVATFRISVTAGLYVIGAACLGVGIYMAKHPPMRR